MAALTWLDRSRLLPLGLALLLALLTGCAAPLGPGYHIRHETVTVRYQPGVPALHYTLQAVIRNAGNRPLSSLEIQVPRRFPPDVWKTEQTSGRATTDVIANDREMRFSLSLKPALGRRQSRELRFAYLVPVEGNGLLLEPRDWFPILLPPHALFAKGEPRARRMELNIIVPSDFRALTTGRARGVHADRFGGETEYRYETRGRDFLPFLLIGRFERRRIRSGKTDVVFWTRKPLGAACSQSLAAHLANAVAFYRVNFGPMSKHRHPLPVIEIPPGSASRIRGGAGGFGPVPGGVWFSVAPSELCAKPKHFFMAMDRAMAATWFGWVVAPEPDAKAILGGGVRRYAAFLAEDGSKGAAARARQVRAWLEEYDRLRPQAKSLAPIRLSDHSLPAQRRMAGIQSGLCLIALEDQFGSEPVRRALAHLTNALRNSTAGFDDVRSALEQETGRNLFDFFNMWLGRPGIPPAFRQHYLARKQSDDHKAGSSMISRRTK